VTSLLGYSRAELLSGAVCWADLTPKELTHLDRRAIEQLAATGVAGVREKEYLHRDGHHVPVLVGSATIPGSDGQTISFVLDLSDRKRAEQALAEAAAERALASRISGLLDAAPDALVTTTEEGCVVLVNSQAERLFGYSREELIGRQGDILIPPRFRAKPAERSAYLRENANARTFGEGIEICGLRKDGTELPIELRLSPMKTPEGILITSAIRDVTERHKADEVRARLAAIVDSSHDAIIGNALDGTILTWNHGAERLFGYTASEAVGRAITMLVPEDRLAEETDVLARLREGAACELETVRVRKGGSTIDVWVTTSPVLDARGKIIGAAKIARDVGDRKRNEDALLRANAQAEIANRELEAFSYSVAHDLRAPLRGMNGFAQLLVNEYASKLDDEGRDWLGEIVQNSKKMGALIDALLSMSRFTRTEMRKETVDLSAVARSIAQELARQEPERAVEVVVEDNLHALVDPALGRALLQNLLANAWKFTGNASNARIEVGGIASPFGPSLFVRDNGVGFDMAFAKKLFTPFQRLHSPAEFPGTGIGLANVSASSTGMAVACGPRERWVTARRFFSRWWRRHEEADLARGGQRERREAHHPRVEEGRRRARHGRAARRRRRSRLALRDGTLCRSRRRARAHRGPARSELAEGGRARRPPHAPRERADEARSRRDAHDVGGGRRRHTRARGRSERVRPEAGRLCRLFRDGQDARRLLADHQRSVHTDRSVALKGRWRWVGHPPLALRRCASCTSRALRGARSRTPRGSRA
jgi:PAS domain S-box-containing protein